MRHRGLGKLKCILCAFCLCWTIKYTHTHTRRYTCVPRASVCALVGTNRNICKYVIWQTHYMTFSALSEWLLCFQMWGKFIFSMLSTAAWASVHSPQNAEWVQIAVMKLFHYGDEQCWINKNNKAECFIEPSVQVLWQGVQLCLQRWWLARGQRWLLAKWNNSYLQQHPMI